MSPSEVYEAGLCSTIPTVFDECKDDWISKNGTCYQDSCCATFEASEHVLVSVQRDDAQAATSWFYRMAQFSHVVFSCVGIVIATFYVSKYASKHMLPSNVRVLVNIMLLLIVAHSIDMTVIHAVISTLAVIWIYRNDDPDAYLLSCINLPSASVADMTTVTIVIFPINFVCFFLSIVLFRHFKRKEKGSRFDIVRHFTAAVDVESSEFLYRTTGTQAAMMVLFSVASLTMRVFYHSLPRPIGLAVATLSYTFSIYSLVVPLVMLIYARGTTNHRKERIWSQVGLKSVGVEGADHYFGMMKTQWE
ncbi:unnamed protein product [Caenorhabditis sp. 36 PRJEB53466]|nr:unnamed protein product [Caenorhabditis sp. 36 PRJEB53466]